MARLSVVAEWHLRRYRWHPYMFISWYLIRFAGESPFSHSALDIKTFAMVLLGVDYREATKRNMPREWFGDVPHTHVALDDAVGQGVLFCNMLARRRITSFRTA